MRTLYHHWLSPSSRKIRIILGEKKLDCRLKVEKPWALTPELIQHNPGATLPVLIDLDHTPLYDANTIMEYLEEAYPGRSLIGDDIHTRAESRRLSYLFDVLFNEDVTLKVVHEKVFKRHFGYGHPDPTIIRSGMTEMGPYLNYMENLIEQRNWLSGPQFSIADITAAAHLSCLDYIGDIHWDRYKILKDWYARIKSRPSFRNLLNDNVPGVTPPAYYADLDF